MLAACLVLVIQSVLGLVLPEKESINWRSRRELSWADFKGPAIASAPNAAMTSTSILIDFGYDNSTFHYHLSCVFYPEKSWTKVSSPHILGHEQGHFDISQLFTRKLHEALKAYKFRQKSADSDIKAIYEKIAADQSRFQVLYDQQTNYSRNSVEQGAWQERIKQELSNYSEYANYP